MSAANRAREERSEVLLSARMLAEQGWRDVTICNVSSRGLMLRSKDAPARNTFIEIKHQKACIIGRVVWSSGTCFGIRTQDAIDLAELLAQSQESSRKPNVERRVHVRSESFRSVQMRTLPLEDSSRILARIFDWSAIVFTVVIGAYMLTDVVSGSLQEPLGAVRYSLQTQNSSME